MKKVLLLLLTISLFAACNNDKDKNTSTDREKDDYNSRDTTTNKKEADKPDSTTNTKNTDEPGNTTPTTNYTSSGRWPSSEVNAFITNCVSSAVEGGMDRPLALRYCECMQVKLETLYPDVKEASLLTDADMETPAMKRLVRDCLKY
ncbi:MAG: hypothetical protein ABIR30_05270 [Chitinophagaceae bacterium]